MSEAANVAVTSAIDAIKKMDAKYWQSTLEQRLVSGMGSRTYFADVTTLEEALRGAEWEEYSHPDIMEGCRGYFTTQIPGLLGVVNLHDLDPSTPISWEDPKDTGKVTPVIEDKLHHTMEFTVLIVGPEYEEEVVYTFHPGAPVRPSSVELEDDGTTEYFVGDAIRMGCGYAKLK